nr:MAG TPA: hypothetical protein [Caudoviricetes sp.]
MSLSIVRDIYAYRFDSFCVHDIRIRPPDVLLKKVTLLSRHFILRRSLAVCPGALAQHPRHLILKDKYPPISLGPAIIRV